MMVEALRTGSFLTTERMRVYSWISIALMLCVSIAILVTSKGNLAWDGKPLGTDFSNVYAAGLMANAGQPAEVWDWNIHFAKQSEIFGPQLKDFYGWHYPPFFLLIASVLAFFPYLVALGLWNLAGFVFYLSVMRKLVGKYNGWLLPVIGFPAIFVNVSHGHNGFLTAGLFGLAFLFLDRLPLIAGICIGLLAYKPQFGMLIPIALLLGGYYRSFISASLTVLAMSMIVTLIYGLEIWPAFFESFELTQKIILEQGATGWYKIQSMFSFVMLWTDWLALAYALQSLTALAVLAMIVIAFWHSNPIEDRAALIIIGSLLVTPYSLDYDLVATAPAIAFLTIKGLRDGFADYEITTLLALWFSPLLTRPLMMATGIPLALVLMLIIFAIVSKRVLGNNIGKSPA